MKKISVTREIQSIPVYTPGKPIEEVERELGIRGSIKLASNENPRGPSKRALRAIKESLKEIHRYPESNGEPLVLALAKKWRLNPEQILLGNGSNEIIEMLTRTLLVPGDETIFADWTFSVYQRMVLASNGKPVIVPLKLFRHDLTGMAARISRRTKIIFICNPNNPTGTFVTKEEMDRFFERIPDRVIVVMDEAYGDFVTHRQCAKGIGYLRAGRNLVVLRTFSKVYGLAGLRLGYGMGSEELVSYMKRVRQPFNTSLLAQRGGLAALSDETHVRESLRLNQLGRHYLYQVFDSMGVFYLPTQANFILIRIKEGETGVYEKLLKKGVIVRNLGEGFLRVTIGVPEENKRFENAFREVVGCEQ
ncbi:MAG TPA: histidinol-phosphate transaminase [Nitrospiria bacterium]|jgi:histidinol-phosphate aminotransferase